MESWFIRHWPNDRKWDHWTAQENIEIQQKLFDAKEVAIHYYPTCNLEPNAYPKEQRKYIETFLKLAASGGYVCAHYPAIRRTLIGKLIPTKTQNIACSRDFFYLKRLKLNSGEEVCGWQQMILLVAAPRMGTMGKWRKIDDLLRIMIDHEKVAPQWKLLPPSVQETVCQEYLREKYEMSHLLLPFGRTLKDVDAAGIDSSGNRLFSQVTHSTDKNDLLDKVKRLKEYGGHCFFFCPQSQAAQEIQEKYKSFIHFVWTDDVWKWLQKEKHYIKAIFDFLET